MLTLILQFIALLYVFVAPGTLVVMQLESDWTPPVQVAVGFAVSALTIPILCFCVAWILGTNIGPALVIAVATGVNLAAGASWLLRRKRAAAGG